jgi:hypothetical protein
MVISNAQPITPSNYHKYAEQIEDPYLANEFGNKKTAQPFHAKNDNIFTTQVNIDHLDQNILGDAANEPSIAIDPTDPDRMVIGWRQFDNVKSNFRQAGFAYTEDGGNSWIYPENIEAGVFRSDPVLDADMEGNFYYNSLTLISNNFKCNVFKSETKGTSWNEGVDAKGGDKQWMVVDKTSKSGQGNIYAVWNAELSSCNPGAFTRSTDNGLSFENCSAAITNPKWGTMAIGKAGDLYIGGEIQNELGIIKSSTIMDSEQEVVWDFSQIVDLDGRLTGWRPPNPVGLLGQLSVGVDTVTSAFDIVYLAATVDRFNSDPADVMFARSLDGGETWDAPIRINKDNSTTNFQWFGTMSVAPDGRIDIIWLDTRDDSPDPYWSSLYYSYSVDQGESWSEDIKLSEAFDPQVGWPNQSKMGDYFHMISDNEYAHLAWTNTFNNEQDVYYSRITPILSTNVYEIDLQNQYQIDVYPNPSTGLLNLGFKLPSKMSVSISIKDLMGKTVLSAAAKDYMTGVHHETLQLFDLINGLYFCQIEIDGFSMTSKIILNR